MGDPNYPVVLPSLLRLPPSIGRRQRRGGGGGTKTAASSFRARPLLSPSTYPFPPLPFPFPFFPDYDAEADAAAHDDDGDPPMRLSRRRGTPWTADALRRWGIVDEHTTHLADALQGG